MEMGLKTLHKEIFPAGTEIFSEGVQGNRAYVIETGKVAIWRTISGQRQTLGVLSNGSIFGEMALIDNEPRMASASAVTETVCIVIGEGVFKKKLEDADPFLVGAVTNFHAQHSLAHRKFRIKAARAWLLKALGGREAR